MGAPRLAGVPAMRPNCDALISKYQEGDEDAFSALFDAQAPLLSSRIQRRLAPLIQRKVSIRDVLQDVRIVAFRLRGQFTGSSSDDFRRWLGGIVERQLRRAVHHHAGTLRRAVGREVSQPYRPDTAHAPARAASPSQEAIAVELEELARKALDKLSPDYREALRLVREENLTLQEVGERMGRSRDAAKQLHARAMVQFAEMFKRMQGGQHE